MIIPLHTSNAGSELTIRSTEFLCSCYNSNYGTVHRTAHHPTPHPSKAFPIPTAFMQFYPIPSLSPQLQISY